MNNFLIADGADFISLHRRDLRIDNNRKVICQDNFLAGKKSNIRHSLKDNNFLSIRHDRPVKFKHKTGYRLYFALSRRFPQLSYQNLKNNFIGHAQCPGYYQR